MIGDGIYSYSNMLFFRVNVLMYKQMHTQFWHFLILACFLSDLAYEDTENVPLNHVYVIFNTYVFLAFFTHHSRKHNLQNLLYSMPLIVIHECGLCRFCMNVHNIQPFSCMLFINLHIISKPTWDLHSTCESIRKLLERSI